MKNSFRKFLTIVFLSLTALFATESIVGDYKLNGTDVLYTWITRADESLDAVAVLQTGVDELGNPTYTDLASLGLTEIPFSYPLPTGTGVGQIRNGPLSLSTLTAMGINLNLSLYEDGTGAIYQGSYYPGADFDLENCETVTTTLPVTDYLEYSSDQNANLTGYTTSMIGDPATGPYAGQAGMGSFGLESSDIFDYFPATATLVDHTDFVDGYADLQAPCSMVGDAEGCATFGYTGGFYTKGNVAPWLDADLDGDGVDETIIQAAGDAYVEWHAVDGAASQSGLGELDFNPTGQVSALEADHPGCVLHSNGNCKIFYDGVDNDDDPVEYWNPEGQPACVLGDEDCDNTPFDRILGVTGPPIVRFNPYCGPPSSALDPLCPGLDCPSAFGNTAVFGTMDAISDGAHGAIYGGCLSQVSAGVYGACLDQVEDGAEALCETAGSPIMATTGLCSEASQTPEFAAACAAYGGGQALIATCMQLGFTAEDCASAGTLGMGAVAAYCTDVFDDGTNVTCDDVGYGECDVLTNSTFADGLCYAVASQLTTSTTCDEWAAGLAESTLDGNAEDVIGYTCTDYSNMLATGLATGDATAIETLNNAAAGVIGMTCSGAADAYVGGCIESSTANEDTEFHVMDARFAPWGGFFTANAASCFGACGGLYENGVPNADNESWVNADGSPSDYCMAADLTAMGIPNISSCDLTNDSEWNLTASGAMAGDVSGRLTFQYDATCLRVIEAHEVNIDFTDVTGQCYNVLGDINGSCEDVFINPNYEWWNDALCVNVADIVVMVNHILGQHDLDTQELCQGDIDENDVINVVDVVQTVQLILSDGPGLVNEATSSDIVKTAEGVKHLSNGTVGAIQLTITHDENFEIELTEDAMVAEYSTTGNKTTVVIVMPETVELFTANGQYEISEVLAANSNGLIESAIVAPEEFSLSNAYPNPFNPSTTLLLNLDQDNFVMVKVFNINGNLVDVLSDGNMDAGMHTITWDAKAFASGVYFIKANIGSEQIIQKVSLMK